MHAGEWLRDGACPRCKTTWPDPQVCHVCGGPAKPGDYWRTLGALEMDPGPEVGEPGARTVRVADLLRHACGLGDISASESGRPARGGVNRLLRRVRQRTPYYRLTWRLLLTDYLSGVAQGSRVGEVEQMRRAKAEAEGGAKGAGRGRGR